MRGGESEYVPLVAVLTRLSGVRSRLEHTPCGARMEEYALYVTTPTADAVVGAIAANVSHSGALTRATVLRTAAGWGHPGMFGVILSFKFVSAQSWNLPSVHVFPAQVLVVCWAACSTPS
jgi:hypothetical protein